MMTLNDYREQFRRNLMVMSRTAVGTLDLSASATKADSMAVGSADDAQNLSGQNIIAYTVYRGILSVSFAYGNCQAANLQKRPHIRIICHAETFLGNMLRHAAAPVHARYFLRIPSPMQLNATIVTTIISPGASAHHGALNI